MTDQEALKKIYHQNLDKSIIEYLAKVKHLSLEHAMNIYYRSRLSREICEEKYGIDNMDYKYLVNDLIENEPELF